MTVRFWACKPIQGYGNSLSDPVSRLLEHYLSVSFSRLWETASINCPYIWVRKPDWLHLPYTVPPTGLDECFFNSSVVGVPCSLIFWQFWLFFLFKLVVIHLLVVWGSKAFVPTPPSWLELLHKECFKSELQYNGIASKCTVVSSRCQLINSWFVKCRGVGCMNKLQGSEIKSWWWSPLTLFVLN